MTHATPETANQIRPKIGKNTNIKLVIQGVFASSSLFCSSKPSQHFSQKIPVRYAQSMAPNRWLRPEVYPLFAATGVAVGICGLSLFRHITTNPEVRVTKENRAAGILENFAEGEKYKEHYLRKFVRNKSPEIMPSVNGFFTDPSRN